VFTGSTPDGVLVPATVVCERVGRLVAHVQEMTGRLVAERWNPQDLQRLTAGVDADGKRLPANGWMAARRLGWIAVAPAGVRVSDRVRRIAEAHAARLLCLAMHRDVIIRAIVRTWPVNPKRRTDVEWQALRTALPPVSPAVTPERHRGTAPSSQAGPMRRR
jgi:hypothetical protein